MIRWHFLVLLTSNHFLFVSANRQTFQRRENRRQSERRVHRPRHRWPRHIPPSPPFSPFSFLPLISSAFSIIFWIESFSNVWFIQINTLRPNFSIETECVIHFFLKKDPVFLSVCNWILENTTDFSRPVTVRSSSFSFRYVLILVFGNFYSFFLFVRDASHRLLSWPRPRVERRGHSVTSHRYTPPHHRIDLRRKNGAPLSVRFLFIRQQSIVMPILRNDEE